jgi:hypothetical protein
VKIGVGCSAEARGRKLFLACHVRAKHRPDGTAEVRMLSSLMIYATATGRSVEDVTLAQLRYRLCETQACPSASSTGRRCRAPLYRRICKSRQDAELGIFRWIEIRASGHALPGSMRSTYYEVRTNTPLHNEPSFAVRQPDGQRRIVGAAVSSK